MPKIVETDITTGSHEWLGSDHGIGNCRTYLLDVSKFDDSDNYPDGYIPAGTPVVLDTGALAPYESANDGESNGGGTNPLDVLVGHLFADVPVTDPADKVAVAVLAHGTVIVANVPQGVDSFAEPNEAQSANVQIVYL